VRLAGGPNGADLVNQPGDVSYALSGLLDLSAEPGDPYAPAVRHERTPGTNLARSA
jgi:hypothetical protein